MYDDYITIERMSRYHSLASVLFLCIFEVLILFGSFLLNVLFLCLLLQYSVFHIHLRIICLHITSAVTLLTGYSLIRSMIILHQFHDNSIVTQTSDSSCCFFDQVIPTCFCLLFITFPLILVIERGIATEKVRGYEDFHFPSGMMRFCLVFWIPVVVWLIGNSFSFPMPSSVLSCELQTIGERSPIQRSVWYLLAAFFNLIFSMMFRGLATKNQRHEVESITSERSRYTLSHRFQLRENSRTCSFLISLQGLICLTFLALYAIDFTVTEHLSHTDDVYVLLFRRVCFEKLYCLMSFIMLIE
ncbi:hypothetical protein DICVIV_05880 [Dictyocaulus viviparus]|uniref:G-protein coupled receptors family 1 profile domain-containing protein n=1 Tax=Dictyocaulus viviparus TaxID=29172 RepID=A0A0D8XU37_DICVI|nr:hypothetical protein DICVIV_05880 [Dictyocaulus viviparus]